MRVAILTPYYHQATRGNAVTVRRIERHLRKLGHVVEVFSLERFSPDAAIEAAGGFSPHIIHAFHGVKCGAVAAGLARETGRPYVITITGTELCQEGGTLFTYQERTQLENAAALVVFHGAIGRRLAAALPAAARRVVVIHQGVEVPGDMAAETLPEAPFNFLLPAGIRPVKNILSCFSPLEELWRKHPQVRLQLAGPVLDADCFTAVTAALERSPFAAWLGEVPYSAMSALYRSAHVVLNTSHSEGGMANSLLEGMAHGRSVLAADIEGNRSLVQDGVNGFLYGSAGEFLAKAERLLLDKTVRARIAAAGRSYVMEQCSVEKEAAAYQELFTKIIAAIKRI